MGSLRPKRVEFHLLYSKFQDEVTAMFSKKFSTSGMTMYQLVYDICNVCLLFTFNPYQAVPEPFTERLFNTLSLFLESHCRETCANIMLAPLDIVKLYAQEWMRYRIATSYLSIVCEYLDRTRKQALPRKSKKPTSILFQAYTSWQMHVLKHIQENHQNHLTTQILMDINHDRDGKLGPTAITNIKCCVESLVVLDESLSDSFELYIDYFEILYLQSIKEYYEIESHRAITSMSISLYLQKADARSIQESERCKRFLNEHSFKKAMAEFDAQYIHAHSIAICLEFLVMLREQRRADMKLAFGLLSRISQGVIELLKTFENYIISLGRLITSKVDGSVLKDPTSFVESCAVLQASFTELVCTVFSSDLFFTQALDRAFCTFINEPYGASSGKLDASEILARYCDVLLRRNIKIPLTDSEIEMRLEKMIILFKYIEDKDVFQKYYSRQLAKRLIFHSSASDDAEAAMISKLSVACGVEYTTKLQRMFTDISTSQGLSNRFKQMVKQNLGDASQTEISISILTSGSWPLAATSVIDFQLPKELQKSADSFASFYTNLHNGRKLTWLNQYSKGDVRVSYLDRNYEFNLSLYHIGVLLLFNDCDCQGVEDISSATKLDVGEVIKIVKSFLDIKLVCIDNSEISTSSIVSLNMCFKSKKLKMKIATAVSQVENNLENDVTRKAIDEDRKLYLQASIVRIMKARRNLPHLALMDAIIDMVKSRFLPDIPLIKRTIEQLIEKQFIARSESGGYNYVS